jgi:hypothetical protein
MPQFGAIFTDDSRVIIYGRGIFIMRPTGLATLPEVTFCIGHNF